MISSMLWKSIPLILCVVLGCDGPVQKSAESGDSGASADDDSASDDDSSSDDDSASDDDSSSDDDTGGGADDDPGGGGASSTGDDDGPVNTGDAGQEPDATPDEDQDGGAPVSPEMDAGEPSDPSEPEPDAPANPDAGSETPIDVELPPRPEIEAPPAPDVVFDEASCSSPREGDHVIEIQADIVDLDGIDCIIGDLNIWPTSLTAVLGLESLRYVSGTVLVGVSPSLNSLSGLDGLEHIGGDLIIQQTPVLVSATGLGSLTAVGGNVRILQNVILQTTAGLDGLQRVGGDVLVEDNANLGSFADGFSSLIEVGGKLIVRDSPVLLGMPEFAVLERLGDGAELQNNPYLGSVSLPSLTVSGGDVVIGHLGTTSIDLGALEGVLGNLSILDETLNATSPALSSVNLGSLELIEGDLTLQSGENLLELSLPALSYVDGSALLGILEAVLDLDAPSLARIGGTFTLRAGRLRAVEFPSLVEVGDTLDFGSNERLDSITLPALTVVGGPMYFGDLPSLVSVAAPNTRTAGGFQLVNAGSELDTLESVDLGALETLFGPFTVSGCAGEPAFDVPLLESVESLTFESNRFPNIDGFQSLHTVEQDVVVNDNETLIEFAGFDALTTIGNDLWVIGNPTLQAMTGLAHVQTVTGTFKFSENPAFGVLAMDLESVTRLEVNDNAMAGIHLPSLTTLSSAFIYENDGLSCLYLPLLTDVVAESSGSSAIFSVYANPSLAACQVEAIIAQIENPELISTNTQNGDGGNCNPTSCQ